MNERENNSSPEEAAVTSDVRLDATNSLQPADISSIKIILPSVNTASGNSSANNPDLNDSFTIHEEHFVHNPSRKTSESSASPQDSNIDPLVPSSTGSPITIPNSSLSIQNQENLAQGSNLTSDICIEDPLMRELDRIASLTTPKSLKTNSPRSNAIGEAEKNEKRRVKFPDDDNIVLGYMEPHYHWNNVPSCTTEELLSAYRLACAKNKVNPIAIVLEQLKGIDPQICNERYETFNLRGVKLTARDVETLEQVFRRVQFRTLDFDSCNLDDETGSSLFDMIEYYESCTKLNISGNPRVGARGLQSCSRMIKKTPCLETLIIRQTMFVDTSMPALGRSLRMGCINLRQLHLEHCNVCGRNLLILVSALKMNETLRELYLSNNNLMPTDGIQLGALLKANRFLRLLDVRNNSLGDVGTCHLCDGLFEQSAPPADIASNPNSLNAVEGVTIISNEESTNKHIGGLEVLLLGNNGITHVAMVAMAEALRRCAYLRTLSLGCNNLGGQGIHALKEGLLCNRSLIRLQLPACKINCEGAVALAEYIADSKQLQRLDLRENDIRTAGLMGLSHALRLNDSVTRIDLDKDPKKEPLKEYAKSQMDCLERVEESLRLNRQKAEKRIAEEERLALLAEKEEENSVLEQPYDLSPEMKSETSGDYVSTLEEIGLNSLPETHTQSNPEILPVCHLDRPEILSDSFPSEIAPCLTESEISPTILSIPVSKDHANESCDPTMSTRIVSPTDELFATEIESFFEKACNGAAPGEKVVNPEDPLNASLGISEEQLNAEVAALPLTQRLLQLHKQRHRMSKHSPPGESEKNVEDTDNLDDSSFEESEIDPFSNGFTSQESYLSMQYPISRSDTHESDLLQPTTETNVVSQQQPI